MNPKQPKCPKEMRLWEEEFSVAAGEQASVERRQLSKFLLLTSGAMFTGQLWLAAKGMLSDTHAVAWPRKAIASTGDVPVNGAKIFQYPNDTDDCILVRVSEDRFAAYSQKCTHLSCAVIYATDRRRLECPCHEGYFSVEDGHVIQGPPPRPLPRVLLEIQGTDIFAVGISVFGEA